MGVRTFAADVDIPDISLKMQAAVAKWMNGRIQIINPDITGGEYNRSENIKERTPLVIWEGKSRIQAVRWPTVATSKQAGVALREIIFHIPYDADDVPLYIPQGHRVRVLNGGMSPQFEGGLYVITTAVNSSYDWDRRIETTMDQGAPIDWA